MLRMERLEKGLTLVRRSVGARGTRIVLNRVALVLRELMLLRKLRRRGRRGGCKVIRRDSVSGVQLGVNGWRMRFVSRCNRNGWRRRGLRVVGDG